jgi:hypothetical protein
LLAGCMARTKTFVVWPKTWSGFQFVGGQSLRLRQGRSVAPVGRAGSALPRTTPGGRASASLLERSVGEQHLPSAPGGWGPGSPVSCLPEADAPERAMTADLPRLRCGSGAGRIGAHLNTTAMPGRLPAPRWNGTPDEAAGVSPPGSRHGFRWWNRPEGLPPPGTRGPLRRPTGRGRTSRAPAGLSDLPEA